MSELHKTINRPFVDGTGLDKPREAPLPGKVEGHFNKCIRVPLFCQKSANDDAFELLRLAVSLGTKARVMWFDPFYETIADGGKFDLATFHRFIQKINGVCKTKEFSSVSSVTFEFIIMKDHTKFGKHWLDTRNQCDAPSQHLPVSVAPRQHFL